MSVQSSRSPRSDPSGEWIVVSVEKPIVAYECPVTNAVVAIIAPFAGNAPTGSALEFWVYLVSAVLLPPAAVAWALVERSRWSTVIMGIAALAVAVMVWRMQVIWTVQVG